MLTEAPVIPAAADSPPSGPATATAAPDTPPLTAPSIYVDPWAAQASDAGEWKETVKYFRRLGVYLWPYKSRFIMGEVAGLAFAFFNGIMPLLLTAVLQHAPKATAVHAAKPIKGGWLTGGIFRFVDHLAEGKYGVLIVCSAIPAVMILRCFFDYLNNYQVAWVSLKVLADMRRQVFAHINSQSLNFFHQSRSGNLISRVNNDTRIVQTALGYIGTDLIEQPATAVVVVLMLFNLDWRFTLMALVLFPACMAPLLIYGKRIRKNGRQEEEQSGAMTSILQETFAGIRVIKSFAREDYQVQQFDVANVGQFETGVRVRRYTEIVGPLVEIVAALGVGLALVYVHYAGMELAKFIGLTMGLFLLYTPIKQISRMHMQIQKCRAASANVFALLALEPTVQDAPGAVALADCRGEVEFKSLYFQYEGAPSLALDNFTLRIRPGKTVALVGTSGAGKSTVLSLLATLLRSHGRQHLRRWPRRAQPDPALTARADRRRHPGYLPSSTTPSTRTFATAASKPRRQKSPRPPARLTFTTSS